MASRERSILVVEDDIFQRELLAESLGRSYEVAAVGSQDRLFDFVVSEKPSVVLLDLVMEGRETLAICREIKICSRAKVLFVTGRDDRVSKLACFASGADDLIVKPFHLEDIRQRVFVLDALYFLENLSGEPEADPNLVRYLRDGLETLKLLNLDTPDLGSIRSHCTSLVSHPGLRRIGRFWQ